MSSSLPTIYLARHGETAWSLSGQHTGLTDIPLTAQGERDAVKLGERLRGLEFAQVITSPLRRARRTCELAGFEQQAQSDHDLVEWNYGRYDGRTTADIKKEKADWIVFRDGAPGGESVADVTQRADRVVARLRNFAADTLVFSSGHFLRALAARWCGLPLGVGANLYLATATLSILGYDHGLSEPVIKLWNDARHKGE